MGPKAEKKSGGGGKGGGGGGAKKVVEKKEDLILACSIATTGRTPCDGYIMSLGFCAMTINKKIMGTFSANMLPLSTAVVGATEVLGFWRGRREELEAVTVDAKPPSVVMNELIDWCKSFGKVNLTLVANPMLTVFTFLSHYLNVCCPTLKSPPWGYSGTCVKSYCCGLLGVDTKAIGKDPTYVKMAEGLVSNMVPGTDAVVIAVIMVNAMRLSLKLDPITGPTALPAAGTMDSIVETAGGGAEEGDEVKKSVESKKAQEDAIPPLLQWFDPTGPFCSSSGQVRPPPFWGQNSPRIVGEWLSDSVVFPFVRYPSITDPLVLNTCKVADAAGNEEEAKALLAQCNELLKGASTANSNSNSANSTADEIEWVATEKVHGSNLSIITDGKNVRVGKRNGLLSLKEATQFFSFDMVLSRIQDKIFALYRLVDASEKERLGDSAHGTRMTLFGEIAGGEYNHPSIPLDLRGHKVQAGVQYAPFNFFYAFDIMVTTTNGTAASAAAGGGHVDPEQKDGASSSSSSSRFLPFDEASALIDKAGILRAEVIARGPLSEVLKTSPEFPSTVPSKFFQLPALSGDNAAEGVVIRPVTDLWVAKVATAGAGEAEEGQDEGEASSLSSCSWSNQSRVMFKVKHPKFREMVASNAPLSTASLPEVAMAMVTKGRLDSVLSKLTLTERGDKELVFKVMLDDVIEAAVAFTSAPATDTATSAQNATVSTKKKAPIATPSGADFLEGKIGGSPSTEKSKAEALAVKDGILHLIA